ncbi:MAG: Crp/Fnr family transcriptional regulator [Chloroflexi bacterium]|nr:Crp/Fnr family transcriptional regulator [Chloroflexota bacterium]
MVSADVFKEFAIFGGLNEAQLKRVAAIAREESHPAGAVLFKEGDSAGSLYLVKEGKIVLEMKTEASPHRPIKQVTVDMITRGEALGWSSLIEPYKYTLSGLCIDPARIVVIDGAKLRELMKQDNAIGFEVMKGIAKLLSTRLNHTRIMLMSERGLAMLTEY